MSEPRRLLLQLLEYIEEQAKDIDPQGFTLSGTRGFVRRREELVGLPGVSTDIRVEGDHIWLRVARLSPAPPPLLAEPWQSLIRISEDPEDAPPSLDDAALRRAAARAAEGTGAPSSAQEEMAGRARAAAVLSDYRSAWSAWAAAERPRRRAIALYGALFALRHQLASEETARAQELVWGIGIATRPLVAAGRRFDFEYPLLTQAVEITLDEAGMALEIRPRATDTRVELDAFISCKVPGAAEVERHAREHLRRQREHPVSPFDPDTYTGVLKAAAGSLDSHGTYVALADTGGAPQGGGHLVVTDGWVLLSRPRAHNYLFEDLKRLKEQLLLGREIPPGPAALVTAASDVPVEHAPARLRGRAGSSEGGAPLAELYFPLPYNDEQVTIIQYLEASAGVTVQGPPGTGKTHTIANIVCHYLATGRRVLVTSRGERALEVLREKIPEEVRPLTVALLSSDREGVRQFQSTLETIQHQVSQLNPELTRREIAQLASGVDRAHEELALIDRRIDEIAASQLADINVDGVALRAQKLAQLVVSGAAQHGWFDDAVSLAPGHAPPISDEEAATLHEARRRLGPDLVYASVRIPAGETLLSTVEIGELHELLRQIRGIDEQVASGKVLALRTQGPAQGPSAEVLEAAGELAAELAEAITKVAALEAGEAGAAGAGGWASELRRTCRLPSFASERAALASLLADLDGLIAARAAFLRRPVELPEGGLSCPRTREAVARAAATGRPFAPLSLAAGRTRAHLRSVRICGLPPSSRDDWAHVQRFIALHEALHSFVTRWNHCATPLAMPVLEGGIARLRSIEVTADLARTALTLATGHDVRLPRCAAAVFEQPPLAELAGGAEQLRGVHEQLRRHLTRAQLGHAVAVLARLQEQLAGTGGPVSGQLRNLIETQLGHPQVPTERLVARYAEVLMELRRIGRLLPALATVQGLAGRLAGAGAPKLAARITHVPVRSSGEDRVFPPSWRAAWNWARMRRHLDAIESREELITLGERRREIEAQLARRYVSIVAKEAWLSTRRNASPKLLQALSGYATAIRRIGQGTGPNATRYRRDAREAMREAAAAVPCWIMSHARVSESMPAQIGLFDLVIVDEASQSDLWALPAILRARKVLVVGDHRQVSPDAGFVSAQRIQDLKQRFLTGQPYRDEMTPEKSLYELALRVYSGAAIMLREHFRCVPAIIAYSNRSHYGGQIQPLRIPTAAERIEPPLVDIHVEGGSRDRSDRNDLEAQAIAAEIAALLADERFAGRTLGVVSLLGQEQAGHIDQVVRARCDAGELLRRRFECGDARSFQGSERDIIFLSMVVDRRSCRAVAGSLFEQRFNVAASRARDRMVLVRSVTLADLSEKDLRAGLLRHFERPLTAEAGSPALLIERCETDLEREIHQALSARGYRVIPQVKTGAHHIDLVVEGAGTARLAIECDGDELHAAARWRHDIARQRVLERAGWTFWRCFASTWILRREEILTELIERLRSLGIEPAGAIEHAPALVERRSWRPPGSPGPKVHPGAAGTAVL